MCCIMADKGVVSAKSVSLVLVSVILWALSFPILKVLLQDNSPMEVASVRMVITSVVAVSILIIIKGPSPTLGLLKREWLTLAIFGVLYWTVPNVFQNLGMAMMSPDSSATMAGILQCSGPILTIILAVIFLKERPTWKLGVGFAIAFTGSLLLVSDGLGDFSSSNFWGNTLLLASAFSYSLAGIIGKRALERIGSFDLVALSAPFGMIATLLIWPFVEQPNVNMTAIDWLLMAYLALLAGLFAVYLWFKVLEKAALTRLTLFVYLVPLVAGVTAVIFLGESVDPDTYIFGTLIIAGVVLAQL